jgi:uncharacterized protein (TIGR03435 family)
MSRIVTTLGCVWVFAWTVGVAQQPAPVFEAATIKKTAGDTPGASFRYFPGGRFVMTNAPIRGLILSAFPTETGEMIGAPDWIETDRYDVNAKAEGDPPQETMRLMLQSLLRDRLRLRARYEERERDVYFLNVARPGEPGALKLKRSQLDCAAIQKFSAGAGAGAERRPRLWNAPSPEHDSRHMECRSECLSAICGVASAGS